ncbi:hypothetical protein, partial [Vibrio paucivorans]
RPIINILVLLLYMISGLIMAMNEHDFTRYLKLCTQLMPNQRARLLQAIQHPHLTPLDILSNEEREMLQAVFQYERTDEGPRPNEHRSESPAQNRPSGSEATKCDI